MKEESVNLPENKLSKLDKLYAEYQEDFRVDQLNLREKALESPMLRVKWMHMLVTEEKLLRKMEDALDKEIESYSKETLGVNKHIYSAKLSANSSDTVIKIKKVIQEQKDIIRFLTLCVEKGISSYNFELKNIIDVLKLEQG
jgi:gas vesicle protein